MNKVRGPRDPSSQWPPGLRFPDKEICSPGPYSSQRGLFPLLYPPHPPNTRIYIGLLRGDPPPRLALSTTENGDELRKSEQIKIGGPVLRGLGRASSLHPSEVGAPGVSPTPALPNLHQPSSASHRAPPPPQAEKELARWVSVWSFKWLADQGAPSRTGYPLGQRGSELGASHCSQMGRGRR